MRHRSFASAYSLADVSCEMIAFREPSPTPAPFLLLLPDDGSDPRCSRRVDALGPPSAVFSTSPTCGRHCPLLSRGCPSPSAVLAVDPSRQRRLDDAIATMYAGHSLWSGHRTPRIRPATCRVAALVTCGSTHYRYFFTDDARIWHQCLPRCSFHLCSRSFVGLNASSLPPSQGRNITESDASTRCSVQGERTLEGRGRENEMDRYR